MEQLHQTARYLAGEGLRVFPLTPGSKKPPLINDWPNRATDYLEQVDRWWYETPDANIGVRCGEYDARHLFIVDIDPEHGGEDWLRENLHRLFTPTYTIITGTGGKHFYYWAHVPILNSQGNTPSGVAPGVDSRGHHGYGVGEDSIHPTGCLYYAGWGTPRDIAWAPQALVDLFKPKPRPVLPQRPTAPHSSNERPSLDTLLKIATKPGVANGNRNWTGRIYANLLVANGYDNAEGWAAMLAYKNDVPDSKSYTTRECEDTWNKALRDRRFSPLPPRRNP